MIRPDFAGTMRRAASRDRRNAAERFEVNDLGPVFVGGLQQRFAGDDAGIVDQDVEAAVLCGDCFESGFRCCGVGNVEGERAGRGGERGGRGLQAGGVAAVQDDFRAGVRQALGDGSAEASGTAGDEGDTVGEGKDGLHAGETVRDGRG